MINEKFVGQVKQLLLFPQFPLTSPPLSGDMERDREYFSRTVEINIIFPLESNEPCPKGACLVLS